MDKKILKYKGKKNKLEKEILNILAIKKANYENDIVNSNDNQILVDMILNFLNKLIDNKDSKLIIIISGLYSVGKTTFINHLEKYILNQIQIFFNNKSINSNILDQNFIKKIQSDNILTDILINLSEKIIFIELSNSKNNINEIIAHLKNNLIENNSNNINLSNINILPKNKESLKNKYINNVIYDINNNTIHFIDNIKKINIPDNLLLDLENNMNLLRKKNKIFSDDDLYFLDEINNYIYNFIFTNDIYKIDGEHIDFINQINFFM